MSDPKVAHTNINQRYTIVRLGHFRFGILQGEMRKRGDAVIHPHATTVLQILNEKWLPYLRLPV